MFVNFGSLTRDSLGVEGYLGSTLNGYNGTATNVTWDSDAATNFTVLTCHKVCNILQQVCRLYTLPTNGVLELQHLSMPQHAQAFY